MSLEGTDPADRTASGLWPSDHAAIVAKLDMPRHLDWISGNQHSVSLGLAVIGDTMSKAGTPAGASANGSWFLDPRQTGTSQPNPHDNQAGNKVMDVTSVWDWDELGYFIRSLLK
jgi:hypothetical protein